MQGVKQAIVLVWCLRRSSVVSESLSVKCLTSSSQNVSFVRRSPLCGRMHFSVLHALSCVGPCVMNRRSTRRDGSCTRHPVPRSLQIVRGLSVYVYGLERGLRVYVD